MKALLVGIAGLMCTGAVAVWVSAANGSGEELNAALRAAALAGNRSASPSPIEIAYQDVLAPAVEAPSNDGAAEATCAPLPDDGVQAAASGQSTAAQFEVSGQVLAQRSRSTERRQVEFPAEVDLPPPSSADAPQYSGRSLPLVPGAYGIIVSEFQEKHAAEIQKLERQVGQLTTRLGETTDDSRKKALSEQIEQLLLQQFDLRQKSREEELKSLEDRVRKLRENLDKRQSARAEIVKNRLTEIQREAQGLGWGETNAATQYLNRSFEFSATAKAGSESPVPEPSTNGQPSR